MDKGAENHCSTSYSVFTHTPPPPPLKLKETPIWDSVVFTSQITRENYGMTEVKELIPGGESISVDKNNRWGSSTDQIWPAHSFRQEFHIFRLNSASRPSPIWIFLMLYILFCLGDKYNFLNIFCSSTEIIMCSHSCQLMTHSPNWRSRSGLKTMKTKNDFGILNITQCGFFLGFFCPPSSSLCQWHWLQCYVEELWGGRRQHVWLLVLNRWREQQWPKLLLQNPLRTQI